jgi:hypothetical protein
MGEKKYRKKRKLCKISTLQSMPLERSWRNLCLTFQAHKLKKRSLIDHEVPL